MNEAKHYQPKSFTSRPFPPLYHYHDKKKRKQPVTINQRTSFLLTGTISGTRDTFIPLRITTRKERLEEGVLCQKNKKKKMGVTSSFELSTTPCLLLNNNNNKNTMLDYSLKINAREGVMNNNKSTSSSSRKRESWKVRGRFFHTSETSRLSRP